MIEQFDLFTARQERDKGIAKVLANNPTWVDRAIECVSDGWSFDQYIRGEFTGEELRSVLEQWNIRPDHHNGWGALMSVLSKRGLIEKTGEWVQMKQKKSHARFTPLWRFV